MNLDEPSILHPSEYRQWGQHYAGCCNMGIGIVLKAQAIVQEPRGRYELVRESNHYSGTVIPEKDGFSNDPCRIIQLLKG